VGVDAVGSFGAAPAPAAGGAAFAGIGKRTWSVDVEGRADASAQLTRGDGTGVRSSLLLGLLVPCAHVGLFVGCPVLALGELAGEGIKVGSPNRAATFYAAAGLRAGFEAALTALLAVRLHTDIVAPLVKTTLEDRGQDIWTTPAVTMAAGLGVLGRF
jgi:hypothetical protein